MPCVLPVRREGSEGEHRHPHRRQLDERDEFTAHTPEQPLVHEVATGVHRGARDQEQEIPQRETGQEQVWHGAHGLHQQTRLHQSYVPHKTHGNDESVHGRDADARDPDVVPLRRERLLGHVYKQQPLVPCAHRSRHVQRHGARSSVISYKQESLLRLALNTAASVTRNWIGTARSRRKGFIAVNNSVTK